MKFKTVLLVCITLFLFSCTTQSDMEPEIGLIQEVVSTSTVDVEISPTETLTAEPQNDESTVITSQPTQTAEVVEVGDGMSYDDLPETSEWELWPELPVLSDEAVAIYQRGIESGTNPNAFSIFGDCQSLPDAFWGRYDDPDYELPEDLAEYSDVIEWYSGSFDRESVTVKKGTTAAAILWAGWLDSDDNPCEYGETPLECELRIHNPSIVIISLGTHWELRNDQYLRKMIEQLIENNVLPIISTKADHREGEAWVNEEMISIAKEYQLPVWNFWASVQELENHGMIENDPMYMNDAGLEMQRISGLKALDAILGQLEERE